MKKSNKKQLYSIFSKVNRLKLNESILDEIENNIITSTDPMLANIINIINQKKSVDFENEFSEYTLSFKGLNIINIDIYNNSDDITDVYFTFDDIEVFDFTNELEYKLDDDAIVKLCKYIWNNKLWSNKVYEYIGEELDKSDDPSNYIDEDNSDELTGGIGDTSKISDFNRDQLKRGIRVEMEHTSDPSIALDIVMDHLTENPNYYGDNGESCAACNAQNDANKYNPDKDMGSPIEFAHKMNQYDIDEEYATDRILGFKPNNVGDYTNSQ